MNNQPTTAVVILNWNGKHFLEKFLPGVESCSGLPGVSIYVADNASTDDSLSYLEQFHPNVKTVILDRNYGFAEGYNRALLQIKTDFYVLLNSDVRVSKDWLPPLISRILQPGVAACMPKLKAEDNSLYFEYSGAAGGFMDKYGYSFCRGRLFDTVEQDEGQFDQATEIFWATGACCMIRSDVFHQMGGFDISFFAHMEEIDLCWRMKNAGYTIWYEPGSVVYHVGGGMLPQYSPFKSYLNFRNNLLMMHKNLPRKQRKRILFFRMLLDGVAAVHALTKGKLSTIKAILKAHRDFWKAIFKYRKLKDRKSLPLTYPSCVYRHSVVFQYFVRKRQKYNELPE